METPTNPTTTNRTTIIVDDTPASTVDIDQQKDQDPEPSLIDTTPTPVVDTPAMKLFNDDDDDNIGTENTSNPLKTPAKSDNASISAKYDGNENNKRPLSLPPGVTLRAKAVDLVSIFRLLDFLSLMYPTCFGSFQYSHSCLAFCSCTHLVGNRTGCFGILLRPDFDS